MAFSACSNRDDPNAENGVFYKSHNPHANKLTLRERMSTFLCAAATRGSWHCLGSLQHA
jgi:hypothetical protein